MTALRRDELEAVERELSSLAPYRMPEGPRGSLRARLVSEASGRRAPVVGWLGIALGRAAALTAAMILLLSGVAWAVVASAPGDPLYLVKDAIIRLVGTSAREIHLLPTGEETPATIPTAPAEMLAPPSIAPAEVPDGAGRRPATAGPASRPPEPTTPAAPATAAPATAGPSSPARATPAAPPSPPGPRATPAVPPPRP